MLAGKLVAFIGCVSAVFVYVCNAIPQIEIEPAAVATKIGGSPEELVAAGRKVFLSDRAQCLTCHSLGEDPKARCPNQEGLGERAARSRPGSNAAEYLVESVYNPNAFVVSGFPKNQMTPVDKPPIALSHDEILAVLAFLNSLGGTTDEAFVEGVRRVQDPWRKGLLVADVDDESVPLPVFPGDAERGREVFTSQPCVQCHRVAGEGPEICPDLSAIGASQSAEYIVESVLDPNAVIVKGFKQAILVWVDEDGEQEFERGTAVEWIPDREHPEVLVLAIQEPAETVEYEFDLAEVAYVGDTTVAVEQDGDIIVQAGEYVSGDEMGDLTLRFLEEGEWVERVIPPQGIVNVNYPTSSMPTNFAQDLTPGQIYDLLAFLMEQKSTPKGE